MWPTARLMFQARTKFTRKFRKLPLTTKDINKGFYKGTRTGTMGRHTRFGGYIIEWERVRTYVVPAGLDAFKVCILERTQSRRGRWAEMCLEIMAGSMLTIGYPVEPLCNEQDQEDTGTV